MSSPQPPTEPIQVTQDEIPAQPVLGQHARGARNPGEPRRGRPAFRGRRLAIAAAVAVGVASGTAAITTSASHAPEAAPQGSTSALSLPTLHVGATSASFVRRIRAVEARGYVDVSCQAHGDLMFNPRTHRYLTIRA